MDLYISSEEKLQIMRFVCAFAWADLKVVTEERSIIASFAKSLELNEKELIQVNDWTRHPPKPEEIDPFDIPVHLKEIILSAASAVTIVDGICDHNEADLLTLLQNILGVDEMSLFESDDNPEK